MSKLAWKVQKLSEEFGALVEQHEGRRTMSTYTDYADDPVGFIEGVLEAEPWSAQREICESVRDHPLTVVRSCNAAGKDWTAGHLALWWVYARRGLVLLTSPSDRQNRAILMSEIRASFNRADLPGELYERALKLPGEEKMGIRCLTSSSASGLTGFHAPRVMAVITEAQGVEGFAWEGLLSCATGSHDRVLSLGNPLNPSGRFYQVNQSADWNDIQISAKDHPNVKEQREVIPGGVSPAFVERMASEYGEGSGTYTARVEGEFPETGQRGLISREWLEEAAERHAAGRFREIARQATPIAGVDPARYGPDQTVVAVRQGPRLTKLVSWGRCGLMETVERLREELKDSGIEPLWYSEAYDKGGGGGRVIVDEVGVGAGVLDRLREVNYDTGAFNSSRRPRERRRFANARSEAYWTFRELLEQGEITLPRDERLFDELTAIRWHSNNAGKVALEGKDEIRNRIGRSPDRADAVVMSFAGRYRRAPSYQQIGKVTWQ